MLILVILVDDMQMTLEKKKNLVIMMRKNIQFISLNNRKKRYAWVIIDDFCWLISVKVSQLVRCTKYYYGVA